MRQWNVLIADDESYMIELITYLIPWDDLNLKLVATVKNGLEAQKVLSNEDIDIIITDARMPGCDGIELIKYCHEQGRKYKYIVISGYRHFEYAHGALQYGVDFYLLKPIKQEELVDSLKTICGQLTDEHEQKSREKENSLKMKNSRESLRRHFVRDYIYDAGTIPDTSNSNLLQLNQDYQLDFVDGVYQGIYIEINSTNNASYNMEKVLARVKEIAEMNAHEFCREYASAVFPMGITLFLNFQTEKETQFSDFIMKLYNDVSNLIELFDDTRLTIGVGHRYDSIKYSHDCICTALVAAKYRIRHKDLDIIEFEQYQYNDVSVEEIYTNAHREMLYAYVLSGNRNGMKKIIEECKEKYYAERSISPNFLTKFSMTILQNMKEIVDREVGGGNDADEMFDMFIFDIDRAVSESQIWSVILDLLEECQELINENRKNEQTKPIRMIKEYIDKHYREAISLEIMAAAVHFSPNYISSVFKRELGISFIDYLTSKRIDAAVELLRKSGLSIAEISQNVGYSDVKYFSRLFKKNLGMKPSEYRKLYS